MWRHYNDISGSRKWVNIANNQVVWTAYTTPDLPSYVVDGKMNSYGSSGQGPWPFVAIDLKSNVPIGSLTLLIQQGKCISSRLLRPKQYPKLDEYQK